MWHGSLDMIPFAFDGGGEGKNWKSPFSNTLSIEAEKIG
jgi:hypothetical protein